MQQANQADFLKNLADDERLVCLMAFNRGMHHALAHLLGRLDGFYTLLELELDDTPGGQVYHSQGAVPLQHALSVLQGCANVLDGGSPTFERFDLQVLLRGMAQRINKVELAEVELISLDDEQDLLVNGNLTLLQQMFFSLPYLFGATPEVLPPPLKISVQPLAVDEDFKASHATPLEVGRYYAVIIQGEHASAEEGDLETLIDKLGTNPDIELSLRLMFCLGVALHHGGDLLALKNETGLDTLLWLLPEHDATPASAYDNDEIDVGDIHGSGTILLVDDEDIIWDVVTDMLQDAGYTVILAANGQDCVEIYRANPGQIDLVLLDMVMPEMNGHQAFFALKEIDPDVKVLLHSGYVAEEDAREVLNAGARGFLQKPYRMAQLAKRISDILSED